MTLCLVVQPVGYAMPTGVPKAHSALPVSSLQIINNPSVVEIPTQAVSLKEVHAGTNGKLIIHIQDAHMNYSGQLNLAKAIEDLTSKYSIQLILSEGSAKESSLDEVRSIADAEEWKVIANRLLYNGYIKGEEYLNLTTDKPVKIQGIEYKDVYDESVNAYAELAGYRKDTLDYLYRIKKAISILKNKMYSDQLLEYENGNGKSENDFTKRLAALLEIAEKSGVELQEKYPESYKLKLLRIAEGRIDFNKAGIERQELMRTLRSAGAGEEIDKLLTHLQESQGKNLEQLAVVNLLVKTALEYNVAIPKGSQLDLYIRYLNDFSRIELGVMFDEIQKLEDEIYKNLLQDPDSRKVRIVDRMIGLHEKAYKIKLSSDEFKELIVNDDSMTTKQLVSFINSQLLRFDNADEIISYNACLDDARISLYDFYYLVYERDIGFIKNMQEIMDKESQSAAFLIAGGYHTQNLTKLLRNSGYSYIVLTPTVDLETDHGRYEKRLLDQIGDSGAAEDSDTPESAEKNTLRTMFLKEPQNLKLLSELVKKGENFFLNNEQKKQLIGWAENQAEKIIGGADVYRYSEDFKVSGRQREGALANVASRLSLQLPDSAYNVLTNPVVGERIRLLHEGLKDQASEIAKKVQKRNSPESFRSLNDEQERKLYERIGRRAGAEGPTVYYPFGGFDVTPFDVVTDAEDIVSVGGKDFGSPGDIAAFMKSSDFGINSAIQRDFDSEMDFHHTILDNQLKFGLGALSILRIAYYLKAEVKKISYFNIQDDGFFKYLSAEDLGAIDQEKEEEREKYRNAVIEFEQDGVTKRLWYIQHDVNDDEAGFSAFADNLEFQTLFIKAAPGMWDTASVDRIKTIRKTLDPAKRNNAVVITDQKLQTTMLKKGARSIWKRFYRLGEIVLRKGESFGYSGEGNSVYFGYADGLIDEGTSTFNIKNYSGPRKYLKNLIKLIFGVSGARLSDGSSDILQYDANLLSSRLDVREPFNGEIRTVQLSLDSDESALQFPFFQNALPSGLQDGAVYPNRQQLRSALIPFKSTILDPVVIPASFNAGPGDLALDAGRSDLQASTGLSLPQHLRQFGTRISSLDADQTVAVYIRKSAVANFPNLGEMLEQFSAKAKKVSGGRLSVVLKLYDESSELPVLTGALPEQTRIMILDGQRQLESASQTERSAYVSKGLASINTSDQDAVLNVGPTLVFAVTLLLNRFENQGDVIRFIGQNRMMNYLFGKMSQNEKIEVVNAIYEFSGNPDVLLDKMRIILQRPINASISPFDASAVFLSILETGWSA